MKEMELAIVNFENRKLEALNFELVAQWKKSVDREANSIGFEMNVAPGIDSIEVRIIQQLSDSTRATTRRREKQRLEALRPLQEEQEVAFNALPSIEVLEREEQVHLDRLDILEKRKERSDKTAGKMVKWITNSLDTPLLTIFLEAMSAPAAHNNKQLQVVSGVQAVVKDLKRGTLTVITSFRRRLQSLAAKPAHTVHAAYVVIRTIEYLRTQHDQYAQLYELQSQLTDQDCIQALSNALDIVGCTPSKDSISYSVQRLIEEVTEETQWGVFKEQVKAVLDNQTIHKRTRGESGWEINNAEVQDEDISQQLKAFKAEFSSFTKSFVGPMGNDRLDSSPIKRCWSWGKTGDCSFGKRCKFTHNTEDKGNSKPNSNANLGLSSPARSPARSPATKGSPRSFSEPGTPRRSPKDDKK
jgi:hypothetical protein